MKKDPYSVAPDTECDPIPPEMRRAVMQTAFTREAKREHLENILRRYDRMLAKAEECLIRVQCLARQTPGEPTIRTDMDLILNDVTKALEEELMTFQSPENSE